MNMTESDNLLIFNKLATLHLAWPRKFRTLLSLTSLKTIQELSWVFSFKMPLLLSYSPNYYSLEDILLQDVRVSCTFEVGVPKLGELSSGANLCNNF